MCPTRVNLRDWHSWPTNFPDRSTILLTVALPVALSAMAVALGWLNLWMGLVAAATLIVGEALGQRVGRVTWSWTRGGRRGFLLWSAFAVCVGVDSGFRLATVWEIAGGVLFAVSLSIVLVIIGYLVSRQSPHRPSGAS